MTAPLKTTRKPDLEGLGGTLRSLRRTAGLTLRELADRIGCSESMLSKIERGHVQPTLRMTHQLAAELSVKVAALLTEKTDAPVYLRTGESRLQMELSDQSHAASSVILERATPYVEGSVLDANLHVVPPGAGSDGVYSHDAETVGFVVLGEITLRVDGEEFVVAAGDSFYFDSRLPYGYHNSGMQVAHVFWVNGFQVR